VPEDTAQEDNGPDEVGRSTLQVLVAEDNDREVGRRTQGLHTQGLHHMDN
jgi:hypothetical protein